MGCAGAVPHPALNATFSHMTGTNTKRRAPPIGWVPYPPRSVRYNGVVPDPPLNAIVSHMVCNDTKRHTMLSALLAGSAHLACGHMSIMHTGSPCITCRLGHAAACCAVMQLPMHLSMRSCTILSPEDGGSGVPCGKFWHQAMAARSPNCPSHMAGGANRRLCIHITISHVPAWRSSPTCRPMCTHHVVLPLDTAVSAVIVPSVPIMTAC